MNRMSVFLAYNLLLASAIGAEAQAPEPDVEVPHSYKMRIVSKLTSKPEGKKQNFDLDTQLLYTWRHKGSQRTLFYDGIKLKVKIDGEETINTALSREKLLSKVKGGENVKFSLENAPEQQKKMLMDTFGAPLCRLEMDENGKEIKRTMVAGPGAQAFVESGAIGNTRLFHAPFFNDKEKWESEQEVGVGNGGSVTGNLSYEKGSSEKGKQIVKVSGTLKNDGIRPPGAPLTTRNVSKVRGNQTFDLTQKDWVSGELTMELFIEFSDAGKIVNSAEGTMVVTFEKLPRK